MIIVAKYESVCPNCCKNITVGSDIEWTPGNARHIICEPDPDRERFKERLMKMNLVRKHEQLHAEFARMYGTQKTSAEHKLLNVVMDPVLVTWSKNNIMEVYESRKFIKKLTDVCIRTLGNENATGIPGGHTNWCHFESAMVTLANALRNHTKTLKRIYTYELSRLLKPHEITLRDAAEAAIASICKQLHIGFELCGDPSGPVVLLHFPNGETNDFGGTGWVVP